ncbi:MAG: hypothetical protein ACRCWW_02015 [Scandinavium sp.]|uniref:hypothetical protein n=1 Tax=Scandinavium sp. TaxID=2830653 RepID=UPI003F3D07A5
MEEKMERYCHVNMVAESLVMIEGVMKQCSETNCDDFIQMIEKLCRLKEMLSENNAMVTASTDCPVFSLAIDIESNMFQRLALLEENHYILKSIVADMHGLTTNLNERANRSLRKKIRLVPDTDTSLQHFS